MVGEVVTGIRSALRRPRAVAAASGGVVVLGRRLVGDEESPPVLGDDQPLFLELA
jgi:hypothetical protein